LSSRARSTNPLSASGSSVSADADDIARRWERHFEARADQWQPQSPARARRFVKKLIMRAIVQHCGLAGGELVLEVGCGTGIFGLALATLGCRCVGLDYSTLMLEQVRSAAASYGQRYGPIAVQVTRQDIMRLGLASETFHLVLSEGVLEHWLAREQRVRTLREMARVARPGGHVAVCIPNNFHPFYDRWCRIGYAHKTGELHEARLSPQALNDEMTAAGLGAVRVEAHDVYDSVKLYWPHLRPLWYVGKALEMVLPWTPQRIRRKWGVTLLGIGEKPGSAKCS